MRLHANEVTIGVPLVRRLLREQHPDLARLPLQVAEPQGTDNVVVRLGDELSVRLPRKEEAVPGLLTEIRWLPRLASELPLPVPTPIASGEPTKEYPFPWAVCRWLEGEPPEPEELRGTATANALGEVVRAMHALDTFGGPIADAGTHRAGPLAGVDADTRAALDEVTSLMQQGRLPSDALDPVVALEVWEAALEAPAWDAPGVWLHRDLHCDNLLAVDGILTGVLDFGGLVVGDPAGNVMTAWHVLAPQHRDAFRRIVDADDGTWSRARGWALSQGLLALPYYLETHAGMVRMARRAVAAALDDIH